MGLGLIHGPQLLFLDEPTTGLDPQGRARLWNEIRRLKETGMTIFLTTHYLEEADVLCDRLAIIDHGRIVAEGTPEQLKHEIAGDVILLDWPATTLAHSRCYRASRSSDRPVSRATGCACMSTAAKRTCQPSCACSTVPGSSCRPSR